MGRPMPTPLSIDRNLINKYDCLAPRYTSYPTAPQFHSTFDENEYNHHAELSNANLLPKDLSLYLHVPFCQSLCYFCGCNKIITQAENKKVSEYCESLMSEIALRGTLFNSDRRITQIHFGGGTPNFLSIELLTEILDQIATHFHFDVTTNPEVSIEIDPRTINPEGIFNLADSGFNRFSIGVQDFSPDVQKAINREQLESDTLTVINAAMKVSKSVNVDLITGLPMQTPQSFEATLRKIIATGVTRIAAYNFAYLPEQIKAQKMIDKTTLPSAELRFDIATTARELLLNAGYQHIGMDHFALPNDSLARAQGDGTLQRNFQGYTTHKDTDLIGIGVSAISKFDTAYAQNTPSLLTYIEMIKDKTLPIIKGLSLTHDDRLRAAVIQQIMCRTSVDLTHRINLYIEKNSDLTLRDYFSKELKQLDSFINDQLLIPTKAGFDITPEGRYFMRQIAMTFDRYLGSNKIKPTGPVVPFSKAN